MIDWDKVSTPGAPPRTSPQTTTAPIPPATSDLTQPVGGWTDGVPAGTTTPSGTYETGKGWRPASQAEIDALDPGERIGRGIDYLGYLLFGNAPDQMGGEQYGHQAPLAGTGPLREVPRIAGDVLHGVGSAAVGVGIKPFEIGAGVLARVPMGWATGSDAEFERLGTWAEANNQELHAMWQQTKAMAEADVLNGGNIKADFNDVVLRMLDDMQYESSLGSTPVYALGGKTVGSLGGALSHSIESFLGIASNTSQELLGGAGFFDPYYDMNESTSIEYLLDAADNPTKYVMHVGSSTSFNLETMNDFERYAVQQVKSGEWTGQQAQAWIDKNINTKMSRLEEAVARSEVGMEVSEVERQAIDAYKSGAWSADHASSWIVSHGQGITRNPVGQIAGTVLTDPLTWATIGLGGVSALGATGLRTAGAANVTIQSMKGLSISERIAASTGNALRIAEAIPNAASNYDKIAMAIAAVQKSPAGPVARVARGLVDPFGVYKPNPVLKTAHQLKGQIAVAGSARAYGHASYNEMDNLAREVGKLTEVREAAANNAFDQADLMVSIEGQEQLLNRGRGVDMMDPTSELNNVDDVVRPMASNYGTVDAETRIADHILEHSKVVFTPEEEVNLAHRLATTFGGGIDWQARVAKMGHDLKSLLHAVTYKMSETGWHNAMNAVDKTAYDGDLPLHLGTIMDVGTLDEEMAKKIVIDIEDILSSNAPDRIELATAEWNNLAARHKRMGDIGIAPGGETQLKALIREMKSQIEQGGFPKVWSEQELAHPALQPLRDELDRRAIPMTAEELTAAKEAARKTATIAFKRKAALEARRQALKDALRALETKSGKVRAGKQAEHDAAQKELEDFLAKHPESKARFDVQAEREAVEKAKLEDEAYLKGFEAAKRSKTGDVVKAKERFANAHPDNADPNSLFEAGWADAQAGKNFGDALAAGGHGVDNLPPPGSMAPTLEETVAAAEASVSGVKRLWKVGSRPDETVAWGLKFDKDTGLPMVMREPTISHNFMAYPGKQTYRDTMRNALGQIIGTVPTEAAMKPVDSMDAFIRTMQDMVTGRRLVMNMEHRFIRSMSAAGVPMPLVKAIFAKAKDISALEKTTIRGLSAAEDGGLWKAIADDIPRDLRLADGTALDIHKVMDHLLIASEGDVRIMGLTSKFSQRMRNAMRSANLDPVNYSGQLTVTQYNKMRYALNPTFLIQRITDSIYYSILYGVKPIGRGALSESNMALQAITDNLARTGMARDFAFDLPEFATRANWTAGVKTALQQAGINENTLSKIANAPDAIIQNNMVNLLHARLGDIVKGVLDNLATAIEKDATLIAGATPEQAYILRRSFADWRAVYSQNAGRTLTDNEVGFMYVRDMLSGWRRVGPIDPATGVMDFSKLIHEGAMMMPSDIGAIGSLMPDHLADDLGYKGANPAADLRADVMGTMKKVGGTYVHVPGEHDLAWLKEVLVNKMGAHPDYVKRAMAYFGDTWDNFWYRLAQPVDKGGLDISEHYAKEAQQIIANLARDRGMDPWEYLSGVMLINSGTDSLDTAVGRFVNFLKKGEVAAEPSDWGAFFRSHLDPSAQTTLRDAYAKAKFAESEALKAPKPGDKFVRTEADGRKFQWHVTHYDPKTGKISLTTNPKGVGRLDVMTREEWDAMKGTPSAVAAATPADVPIQPPLGFITNPHVIASGHDIPIDVPRDGLFHVTTGKDGVMSEGFRGSNAGEEAAAAFPELESKDAYYAAGNIDLANKAASVKAFDALPDEADVWVYHATNEATAEAIAKDGLSQANMPQNLARERYAAGEAAEYAPGAGVGQGTYVGGTAYGVEGYGRRIIAMRVKKGSLAIPPESEGSALSLGDALAEHNGALLTRDVPASDIVILPASGKVPGDSFDELAKAKPKQLQGIGSFGDTSNKGRVSIVTSAARAQAYHDRLLLAVKAARGETDVAEIGDYFEPLYRMAYGDQWGERMATAIADEKLVSATTHTPQELVWIVKRLDDGLVGGTGGLSAGGTITNLPASQGAVHLTSKAEQLARIDPDQIAILNLAVSEKAVAKKGMDVGELTVLPEDLRPMSVAGESKAKGTSFVDPMEDDAYKQQFDAWQEEQDMIANDQVRFNKEQEQYVSAQLAHENDMISHRRDMQTFSRLDNQYKYKLKPEYDKAVAANEAADAQHAAAIKKFHEDEKTYAAEKRAWERIVKENQDVPVIHVSTHVSEITAKRALAKAKREVPGVDFAIRHEEGKGYILERPGDLKPLPPEPKRPVRPEHPGYVEVPPKPIAPVRPEEPVAPTPPKPVMQAKLTKPVPPEPKPMALEQAPEPEIPPVDETEFWDKGIVDMLEKRAKTGPHPNPDVEGALQKVAELTQRVLKDSKGAKNTRTTIRNLGKAIPLTNPVPYNRTHALIQHLVQTKIEESQRDIFRLVEMQTQRTVLERSLNHPIFGLYPASYMWGKVLPESIKFLAKNPYAATYIINDVQRAIAIQREFDPEMEDKMNSVDRSAAAFWVDYMTPGLPWSDHSARMSKVFKDVMKGDLINVIPDSLMTMDPKRWYDQTLRTLKEIPGAVEEITGGEAQAGDIPDWGTGLQEVTAAPPTPGGAEGATDEQIDGAVKAAALAPIIMDDLGRLQEILLGGEDAAED